MSPAKKGTGQGRAAKLEISVVDRPSANQEDEAKANARVICHAAGPW